jgi:hypothetical protein
MKASDIIQGLADLINSIKASDTAATGADSNQTGLG